MWVVYDHPTDHPDDYVARRFNWDKPTEDVITSKDLELLRKSLAQKGLYPLARNHVDDPVIIETWV